MAKRTRKGSVDRDVSRRPVSARPDGVGDSSIASVVERIGSGLLDAELPVLMDAIDTRLQTVADLRSRQVLAQLSVGTRVRLNQLVSPRYLHGRRGEVHDIDGDHIVVCLDEPVGRFSSGHVRCPPLALELTGPTET